MQQVATLGIDAAKNLFQLHGVDMHGAVVLKKRLVRHKVLAFLAGLAPCLIGLEASGSAHYWARELTKLGCVRDACNFSRLVMCPAKFTLLDSLCIFLSL